MAGMEEGRKERWMDGFGYGNGDIPGFHDFTRGRVII